MFHPQCDKRRPAHALPGICTVGGCQTRQKGLPVCINHSIELGLCESCGQSLMADPTVQAPRTTPGIAPGGPRSIAPGGCILQPENRRRAACETFFKEHHSAIFVRIVPYLDHYVIVLRGESNVSTLPSQFWGKALKYKSELEVAPVEPKAWLNFLVRQEALGDLDALLKRVQSWAGVLCVGRAVPEVSNPILERFYEVGLGGEGDLARVKTNLNSLVGVYLENVGDGPGSVKTRSA